MIHIQKLIAVRTGNSTRAEAEKALGGKIDA